MPTYVYRRQDGSTFEIDQRITADPLTECPTTGQPVTRVITGGAGLVFKGSGFYLTDYARAGNGEAGGKKGSEKSTGSDSASKPKAESGKSDSGSSAKKEAPKAKAD
jgi:putative FmdB family regulatory protein